MRYIHPAPLALAFGLVLVSCLVACDTSVTVDDARLSGVYVSTRDERLALESDDGVVSGEVVPTGEPVAGTHLHPRVEFTITFPTGAVVFEGTASNDGSRIVGEIRAEGGPPLPETYTREG